VALAGRGDRRRIAIGLAALALLAACSQPREQDQAEREFNAWANQVEQANDNDPANGSVDFEEPANVLARVVPANAQ
jgi:outer membrane biogenesis lipoprotein LolB